MQTLYDRRQFRRWRVLLPDGLGMGLSKEMMPKCRRSTNSGDSDRPGGCYVHIR